MNKKLRLLCFLLICTGSLNAQRWYGGLDGSFTLSVISGTGIASLNKPGGAGFIYGAYRYNNRFSFWAGLGYIMKGAARNGNFAQGDYYTFSIHLDYLEMPWLLRWHVDKKNRFTLDAGLTHGLLIREEVYENGGKLEGGRGFNKYEAGLLLGFNYHPDQRWSFHIRFRNSILPIRPNLSGQTLVAPVWGQINIGQLNTVLSLGIGLKLFPSEKQPEESAEKKSRRRIFDEED